MPKETIRYSREQVTVVWKPDLCIHTGNCVKGLRAVFNPQKRPWIDMEGAGLEDILAQVGRCPSGALSIEQKKNDYGTE